MKYKILCALFLLSLGGCTFLIVSTEFGSTTVEVHDKTTISETR